MAGSGDLKIRVSIDGADNVKRSFDMIAKSGDDAARKLNQGIAKNLPSEFQAAGQATSQLNSHMGDLANAADSLGNIFERLGLKTLGFSRYAIRGVLGLENLGSAAAQAGGDIVRMTTSWSNLGPAIGAIAGTVGKIASTLLEIGAGAMAAGAGLLYLGAQGGKATSALGDAAKSAKLTVEEFQKYKLAADMIGKPDAMQGFSKLSEYIDKVRDSSEKSSAKLQELQIELERAIKKRDELSAQTQPLKDDNARKYTESMRAVNEQIEKTKRSLDDLAIHRSEGAFDKSADSARQYREKLHDLQFEMETLKQKKRDLEQGGFLSESAIRSNATAIEGVNDQIRKMQEAIKEVQKTDLKDNVFKQLNVDMKLYDGSTEGTARLTEKLMQELAKLKGTDKYASTIKELGKALGPYFAALLAVVLGKTKDLG